MASVVGKVVRVSVKPEPKVGTGLQKHAVPAVNVTAGGVEGDFNRYRHENLADDPDSAVLLMTGEMIADVNRHGWPVGAGDLGENLTLEGVPYEDLHPGTVVTAGNVVLQVSRACTPCTNLYELPYVGDAKGPEFLRFMIDRRGWYARVLRPGRVYAGDPVSFGGTP